MTVANANSDARMAIDVGFDAQAASDLHGHGAGEEERNTATRLTETAARTARRPGSRGRYAYRRDGGPGVPQRTPSPLSDEKRRLAAQHVWPCSPLRRSPNLPDPESSPDDFGDLVDLLPLQHRCLPALPLPDSTTSSTPISNLSTVLEAMAASGSRILGDISP